ncbi:hypothetical protein BGW38_000087 [Lunasporangiospora selenospora]|uniref:Deacetylase sirtuin-type domain-containing protein n=1 Tax=Lunasporangiospora selenospora TaxID=979761 RepID=A0A9P6KF29_9FUNG|nr:hypothetical protein BGW38_000087 [Lunasporangiospora selenospora]
MLTIDLKQASQDAVIARQLQTVTDVMLKAKKTIVVTGAGISCSSGIPDFRSADGLYNLVKKQYPKVVLKGKDLFDANLFRDCTSTAVFYTFISELHAQTIKAKPSPTHHFIKMLSERGKLLRCYTQNIDCLEEEVGMETNLVCENGKVKKDVRVVQLHGSLRKLKCTICSEPYGFLNDYEKVFREGEAPDCPKYLIRVAQGKRKIATGTLRPDIVLYNENHPFGDAIGRIQLSDLAKSPDVLLVMGTSLKVHGLRLLVRKAAKIVHENKKGCVILVNKTPVVGKEWSGVFDYFVEGETDEWCDIVQDALRKVKVQTKLPFKAITADQKKAKANSNSNNMENLNGQESGQEQEREQEQEQLSDKENHVPQETSKKPRSNGKKRSLSVVIGKRTMRDNAIDSIQEALEASGIASAPSSPRLGASTCVSVNVATQGRAIATCRRRTTRSTKPSVQGPLCDQGSPMAQNTLMTMTRAKMSASKPSLRRPALVKASH